MEALDARQRALAENNIRLVYFVLKKMGIQKGGRDYDDLFGAGCVGLCNAAKAWKEGGGCAFSTFAFNAIKREILSALAAEKSSRYSFTSLDERLNFLPAPQSRIDEIEAGVAFEEFLKASKTRLGATAGKVLRLSAEGKSGAQIAKKLGVSLSAVQKAKRKARAEFELWLKGERG